MSIDKDKYTKTPLFEVEKVLVKLPDVNNKDAFVEAEVFDSITAKNWADNLDLSSYFVKNLYENKEAVIAVNDVIKRGASVKNIIGAMF